MTTATMIITRAIQVAKFYDAAGIPETEAEDVDIEVALTGTYYPAEPDVGIMWASMIDICAINENGTDIELTEDELGRAIDLLLEAAAEDAAEAKERQAESRRNSDDD